MKGESTSHRMSRSNGEDRSVTFSLANLFVAGVILAARLAIGEVPHTQALPQYTSAVVEFSSMQYHVWVCVFCINCSQRDLDRVSHPVAWIKEDVLFMGLT